MGRTVKPEHLLVKLLAVRQKLGLSQTGMMRRLKIKCCYTRISKFERGKRTPNLLTLLAYAQAAEVHIDDLVDDEIELRL